VVYSTSALSLHAALHLVTACPALMGLPPPRLAERIGAHASALGMTAADVAELLIRNHRLLDMVPFK
jgi:hypothetical protein